MNNFMKVNTRYYIAGLIVTIFVIICIMIGVTLQELSHNSFADSNGYAAFRMFTVQSNMLLFVVCLLMTPYLIDGIRTQEFIMPKWLICAMYVAISCVTITFVLAATAISFATGFENAMLKGANFFLHLLAPVGAIFVFLIVASDFEIKLQFTLMALTPALLYGIVYIIMVFVVDHNDGWEDFYRTNTYVPWPITILIVSAIAVLITTALRLAHNALNKIKNRRLKKEFEKLFEIYDNDVREVTKIFAIASHIKNFRREKEMNIIIPVRILSQFKKFSKNKISMQELCDIYVHTYSTNFAEDDFN